MDTETITVTEAMAIFHVARSTITRWIKRGDLKAYKLNPTRPNSHFRIYRDSVDRLLAQRQTSPQEEKAADRREPAGG